MMASNASPDSNLRKFSLFRILIAVALVVGIAGGAIAAVSLIKVSTDTFTNSASEHKTEVEPDTYAWGSTIVSAYQVARVFGGGGADIGFSTSTDGGSTWTHGYLPGLTVNYKNGTYSAASDAAVAYDPKHGVWLIASLPIRTNGSPDFAVNRSTDGINWGKPVLVDKSGVDDKSWITCDTTSTSPFYGNCYAEWDQGFSTGLVEMSTSTDGGLTWSASKRTADSLSGIGGQPVVQPNGTVVVPISDSFDANLSAFTSTNGGTSWGKSVAIASQNYHFQAGGIRSAGLPSAAIDGAGTVYVVWGDCRFRSGCSSDDIVMSSSSDGVTWSAVTRIPIDATTSTVDHFIPGLGADMSTSGSTAHLALTYYFYPVSKCNNSCQLEVGFTTSQDGGHTWTAGKQLGSSMQLSWIAPSQNGQMVADYLAVAYSNGNPYGVFALAQTPNGSVLNEFMATTTTPLLTSPDEPVFSSGVDVAVASAPISRRFLDDEGRNPNPRNRGEQRPPND